MRFTKAPSRRQPSRRTIVPLVTDLGALPCSNSAEVDAAVATIVEKVHAHRSTLGSRSMTATIDEGRVRISARMCQHHDSVKLDFNGPDGHRERTVPWKRGHAVALAAAQSALRDVRTKSAPSTQSARRRVKAVV